MPHFLYSCMFLFQRSIAGLFLIIYLTTFPVAFELLRLPNLIVHFQDHKDEVASVGLYEYLFQHYIVEDGTDSDASEDHELPFKSMDHYVCSFLQIIYINPTIHQDFSEYRLLLSHNSRYTISPSILFYKPIWQPPRTC